MKRRSREEFYVGYLPGAPVELALWLRRRVVILLILVAAIAGIAVLSQSPFANAVFEFGTVREFEGVVELTPYPTLVVDRPGQIAANDVRSSRYLLVSAGKFGADDAINGLVGSRVRLRGTLVYRDQRTMIELSGDAPRRLADAPVMVRGEEELGGEETFRGEIVDSKCFLGVMKPGNLKPHRACATRCISGGVPPVLLVREGEDRVRYLLLASADGHAVNSDVLSMVAEPVEITGKVVRYGDLEVLRADPEHYRRIED